MSPATFSSSSLRLAARTTFAPSAANSFAIPMPMPLLEPVMIATLPSSFFIRRSPPLSHGLAARVLVADRLAARIARFLVGGRLGGSEADARLDRGRCCFGFFQGHLRLGRATIRASPLRRLHHSG